MTPLNDTAGGFWPRLTGLTPPALFVWGRHDTLVDIRFAAKVRRALEVAAQAGGKKRFGIKGAKALPIGKLG